MPYADPQKEKEKKQRWYQSHKDLQRRRNRKWKKSHKSTITKANWATRKRLRFKILVHYSNSNPPKCANPYNLHLPNDPFLIDLRVLSLDHINGGGRKDRIAQKSGTLFYYWLQRNNFPDGLQVLCMNCQYVKRRLNKEESQYKVENQDGIN